MKRILLLVLPITMFCSLANAQNPNAVMASNNFSSEPATPTVTKRNAIKIYPNPSYGKLSVIANTSEPLHFYVFDLEGTLVYQAVLNNKDKKNIENLKKGTYIYDVFEKDLSIEEGKIIIK